MDFLVSKKLDEFLNYHKFILDADMFVTGDAFRKEMRRGAAGLGSSLKMLPTYLSAEGEMPERGECLIVDVGGTRVRAAFYVYDGEFVCKSRKETELCGEIDSEGYFAFLAETAVEVLFSVGRKSVERMGFCFSYPTKMRPDLDGEALSVTKETPVRGIEGNTVGKCLKEALSRRGISVGRVVVLNDTVAALCGGAAEVSECGGRIGFVMGTGCNVCYEELAERTSAVGKAEGKIIVNIESGNYNGFPMSDFDREVIALTENPKAQLFEKMTAGRYLGSVFSAAIRTAVGEGIVSKADFPEVTTEEMSRFLGGERTSLVFGSESDRDFASGLGRAIVERSAIMCATIIISVMREADIGRDKPVSIAAEGSTFGKLTGFREEFLRYLSDYAESCGRSFVLCEKPRLNEIGTVFAALTAR